MKLKNFFDNEPYGLNKQQKKKEFDKYFNILNNFHIKNCKFFKMLFDKLSIKKNNFFIPVSSFKKYDLLSVPKKNIFKTLLSSGTSGKGNSKIFLDRETSQLQSKVLTKIMKTILGNYRLPMIILDKKPSSIDRYQFNAKIAAIYGFSTFGKNHIYIQNDDGSINYDLLNKFFYTYEKENIFLFGFTFNVYDTLIKKLNVKKIKKNFNKCILLHGGGWKKMESLKISNKVFKKKLKQKLYLEKIYNYYGLVEQTGSIFLECNDCSCFKTSIFSDINILDENLKIANLRTKGLIHLKSLIPKSYPGHSIITEDIGEIIEDNDCHCGYSGKKFRVHGRAAEAETRGCSDV